MAQDSVNTALAVDPWEMCGRKGTFYFFLCLLGRPRGLRLTSKPKSHVVRLARHGGRVQPPPLPRSRKLDQSQSSARSTNLTRNGLRSMHRNTVAR